MKKDYVAVAKILGAHGIRGGLRLRCDLENMEDILNYDLYDEQNNNLKISITGRGKNNSLLIKLDKVETRNEAEKFIGKDIFIKRIDLPVLEEEDEYYYHDIIGLTVLHEGQVFGIVKDMYNYGAGEILEIEKNDKTIQLFPFNNSNFPNVNLVNNYIEINI